MLLGLLSNEIHSNWFSLVQKIIAKGNLEYDSSCSDSLLTPTKIYVKYCLPLLEEKLLTGLSHITGGGLLKNLQQSLPLNVKAEIMGHPPLPSVFHWMKKINGVDDCKMLHTFNCGIWMVLIVKMGCVDKVNALSHDTGEDI